MEPYFSYRNSNLFVEDIPLKQIAKEFGTPTFVYSKQALVEGYTRLNDAFGSFPHLICYAMKANSNLAILNLFARLGAGFDIVSEGELARVLAAGGDASKIVFSGVGKSEEEIRKALHAEILCFNIESENELKKINQVAGEVGKKARISFRVNPNVDPKTHPYISTGLKKNKFGVPFDVAAALYMTASSMPNLEIKGIDCHIGSQITEVSPLNEALNKTLTLVDELAAKGIKLTHIDAGGGLGIKYLDETPPSFQEYITSLTSAMQGRTEKLLIEPGRSLVGNAGILLTKVEYVKRTAAKNFAIIDAAMNDLMRPALYDAYHHIQEVNAENTTKDRYEVVGPICESGDFIGHDRTLAINEGSLLAVMSAGAYGSSMSSNYNSRGRCAEVLVDGSNIYLIAERESISDLFKREKIIDSLDITMKR